MAIPTVCNIESPVEGASFPSGPGDTASVDIAVVTDPTTPVSIKIGAGAYGAPTTSDGQGDVSFPNVSLPIGANAIRARAGVDPDFLESTIVNVTVTDTIAAIGSPDDHSARWYLAFLAGTDVTTTPDSLLPVMRTSACAWAGVNQADYGTIAALSIKAGRTDPTEYLSVNASLNLIAYSTDDFDECEPWLTDQQALLKISQEA